MKNKLLAFLAAFGLVATVHAVEINDNISINGFIDGSWVNTDTDGAASDVNDLDIDEVELNFLVNAGNVSGEIHIDNDDGAGDAIDLEQVHFTYSMENGLSVTVGRFGSALGFEREDPAGLYTFSRAYDDSTANTLFNIGNVDATAVEGISLGYSADAFSIALSAVNAEGTVEQNNAGVEDDLDIEIALSYTGIENLVLGGGVHSQRNSGANNDRDISNLHAAYTMDKLMLAAEYVNDDNDAAADDLTAVMILADYDINDQMGVAVRYSEWETGANAEADKLTIAPNYAITESLGAILEYSSTENAAGNDVDELALELTFTF
tara:strand:- start:28 stop:993 length:966 start_codon:yes stop_codon:yes gene_type:complete